MKKEIEFSIWYFPIVIFILLLILVGIIFFESFNSVFGFLGINIGLELLFFFIIALIFIVIIAFLLYFEIISKINWYFLIALFLILISSFLSLQLAQALLPFKESFEVPVFLAYGSFDHEVIGRVNCTSNDWYSVTKLGHFSCSVNVNSDLIKEKENRSLEIYHDDFLKRKLPINKYNTTYYTEINLDAPDQSQFWFKVILNIDDSIKETSEYRIELMSKESVNNQYNQRLSVIVSIILLSISASFFGIFTGMNHLRQIIEKDKKD